MAASSLLLLVSVLLCVHQTISTSCPPTSGIYLMYNGDCYPNGSFFKDVAITIPALDTFPNSDYLQCVLPNSTLDGGEWSRTSTEGEATGPVDCSSTVPYDNLRCIKNTSPASLTLYRPNDRGFDPPEDQLYKCCLPTNCSDPSTNIITAYIFRRIQIVEFNVELPSDITIIPQSLTFHCITTGSSSYSISFYYNTHEITSTNCPNGTGCNELHSFNTTYDNTVTLTLDTETISNDDMSFSQLANGDQMYTCNVVQVITRTSILTILVPEFIPSSVMIVSKTATTITVNWTSNPTDADGYVVNATSDTAGTVTQQVEGGDVNITTLRGLKGGATYNITIRAYQDLLGPASNVISVELTYPDIDWTLVTSITELDNIQYRIDFLVDTTNVSDVYWIVNGETINSSYTIVDRIYNNSLLIHTNKLGEPVDITCIATYDGINYNKTVILQAPSGPPLNVRGYILNETSIKVNWTMSSHANGYVIVFTDLMNKVVSSVTGTEFITNTLPLSTYNISVYSYIDVPSVESVPISFTFNVPSPITYLTVIDVSNSTITVNWISPNGDEGNYVTHYNISYTPSCPDLPSLNVIVHVPPYTTMSSYTLMELYSGMNYTITVRAGNVLGESDPMNINNGTLPTEVASCYFSMNFSTVSATEFENKTTETLTITSITSISEIKLTSTSLNTNTITITQTSMFDSAIFPTTMKTDQTSASTTIASRIAPTTIETVQPSFQTEASIDTDIASSELVSTSFEKSFITSAPGPATTENADDIKTFWTTESIVMISFLIRSTAVTSHPTSITTIPAPDDKTAVYASVAGAITLLLIIAILTLVVVVVIILRRNKVKHKTGILLDEQQSPNFTKRDVYFPVIESSFNEFNNTKSTEEIANPSSVTDNEPEYAVIKESKKREEVDAGHIYINIADVPSSYKPMIPSTLPISINDLGTHVAKCHSNANAEFTTQYEKLYDGKDKPCTVGFSEENKLLNRFKNITVYDENRIELKQLNDEYYLGFINASYTHGYGNSNKFIASQGPLKRTLVDFWRLVWQEKPQTIVMVTNLKEGQKNKCEQYWPNSQMEEEIFGPFIVTLLDEQILSDFVIRKLIVKLEDGIHTVIQYHFTSWPDHGVPDYVTPLMTLHKQVMRNWLPSSGPILVHCSAGVGRTGTFIAIDIALEQAKKEGIVDIAGIVNGLREQRMKMVQTLDQYVFIHDAVLELIICGETAIRVEIYQDQLQKLKQINVDTHHTEYESQFHLLSQVTPNPAETYCSTAKSNEIKNRSDKYLPPEKFLVSIHRSYINASFLNGFNEKKAFIVAQSPMDSTVRDFWKMIVDYKVSAIVMLCDLVENGKESCYPYWKNEDVAKFGEYFIETINERKENGYIERKFKITLEKETDCYNVVQFHITDWPVDGVVREPSTVLEVISGVIRRQQQIGGGPIVVHCSDTVSRTGVYCAVSIALEQCKIEGVVDVFQVTKVLKRNKPGAVTTLEQYISIHEVIGQYLTMNSLYENFSNIST